ncbi:unnamed protein product [Dracunculus medinensis]|uniref:SCP domain-containing protein n=1 Tax=Dracunculus medinensis TaxID=318479 RepID=A0A0N4UQQ2_DRAME|nr:unnamed protein product [Dracunculus medinensis]
MGKQSQTTAAVKPKVARRYQTSGKEPAIIMKEATALWWAEATPSKSNIFSVADKATKSNFTQMIWGKSTKVGCSIKQTCNEDNRLHSPFYVDYVVCLFKESGNKVGEPIYDIGNGCNSDNDCTAFSNSRCDRSTSLCELGNKIGEDVYETGLGCSSDSECTQIPNSKCNTDRKLCVAA